MRTLLAVALITVSALAPAHAGDEVPSALDSFLKAMGGSIPFPPIEIIKKLQGQNIAAAATVIPNGRSLERSVTSYSQPRSLLAVTFSDPKPRTIFLAYTPGNQGLQIISQSSDGAKFDFSLISSYAGGKTPEIKKPNPALCIACHQQGGPVFSTFPWSETDFNQKVRNKMLAQKDLDPFARTLLEARDSGPFFANAYTYDAMVSAAYPDARGQLFCREICGTDKGCNLALIKAAAIPAMPSTVVSSTPLSYQMLKKGDILAVLRAIKHRTIVPVRGFGEKLLDRDSFGKEKIIKPGDGNDPLSVRKRSAHAFNESSFKLAPFIDKSFEADDPFYPYDESELITLASDCGISFSPEQLNGLGQKSIEEMVSALNGPKIKKLAERGFPVTSSDVVAAIFNTSSDPSSDGNGCGSNSANLEEIQATVHELTQVSDEQRIGHVSIPGAAPKDLFRVYCSSCHQANVGLAPALPLDDMTAMKKYIGTAKRTVRSVLSPPDFLMPPAGSAYPSLHDRNRMLKEVGGPVCQPK